MKHHYKIIRRKGELFKSHRAFLYRKFNFFFFEVWLQWEVSDGKLWHVLDDIVEWKEKYQLTDEDVLEEELV